MGGFVGVEVAAESGADRATETLRSRMRISLQSPAHPNERTRSCVHWGTARSHFRRVAREPRGVRCGGIWLGLSSSLQQLVFSSPDPTQKTRRLRRRAVGP